MKSKVEKIVNKTRDSSSPTVKHDLSKPIALVNRLIQKEIGSCAQLIGVDSEELHAWIDFQILAPEKTILSLLRIARQYQLDPLQEEILLTKYEDCWQVSISIDGWIKLMNKHPAFAGITFVESAETIESLPTWMECIIYRSDRVIPTTVREHFLEVRQDSDIWKKMPRRMLRHRALQQCARLAIGISIPNLGGEESRNENQHNEKIPTKVEEVSAISTEKITQINKLKEILENQGEN
jgi:hypothetical protein